MHYKFAKRTFHKFFIIFLFVIFVFSFVAFHLAGCRSITGSQPPRYKSTPGYPQVPLHPRAVDVKQHPDYTKYFVPSESDLQVIEFFTRELAKRGWRKVDRMGTGHFYRKGEKYIVITARNIRNGTEVGIAEYTPPREP